MTLRASGSDPQDGTLPSSAFTWDVTLIHGSHQHPYTQLTGARASFKTQQDHDADSYYEITVTARDSAGLTASRKIRINPRTVRLTLASSPAGAPISYSGFAAQNAPYDRDRGGRLPHQRVGGRLVHRGRRQALRVRLAGRTAARACTTSRSRRRDSTLTATYKLAPGRPGARPGRRLGLRRCVGRHGRATRRARATTARFPGRAWSTGRALRRRAELRRRRRLGHGRRRAVAGHDRAADARGLGPAGHARHLGHRADEGGRRQLLLRAVRHDRVGGPSGWARDAVAEAQQPLGAGSLDPPCVHATTAPTRGCTSTARWSPARRRRSRCRTPTGRCGSAATATGRPSSSTA